MVSRASSQQPAEVSDSGQDLAHRLRGKAREAKLPGPGEALPAGLDRALVVAAAFEHVGDPGVGAQLELRGVDTPGGGACAPQRRQAVVALPGADHGELDLRLGLAFLVAEGPGQSGQLLGGPFCLLITAPERQGPAELAEDLGAHPARAAGQPQRRLQVVDQPGDQPLLAQHGAPQDDGEAHRQGAGFRLLAEGRLHQRQATLQHAGPAGGVSGKLDHPGAVGAGVLRGCWHPVPQLQDLLQHLQLLGEGEAGSSTGCRSPGRSQRRLGSFAPAPVQRKPDLGHTVAAERRGRLPAPGRTPVRPGRARRAAGPPGRPPGQGHPGSSSPGGRRP